MEFLKVASRSQLGRNAVIEVMVGNRPYAICDVEGVVYGIGGECPHRGGPLGHGGIEGSTVVCPWHSWEWDCRSGANLHNPAQTIPTFPVRIDNDDILLGVG
ncbi:MAG: Rieske (2Fe-2S) protein [Bryobacteraceae bacterium]